MSGEITQLCNTFFTRFSSKKLWIVVRGYKRFRICVDITKFSTESDLDSRKFSGIVLMCVRNDTFMNARFYGIRNFSASGLRIINPTFTCHFIILC